MSKDRSSVQRCYAFRFAMCLAAGSICSCYVSESVVASSLLGVELIADGSVKPPGDRVECSVLFLPGEGELAIEVRPYTIDKGVAKRVAAKRNENRDPDGHVVLRQTLKSPSDKGGVAKADLIVPYEQLEIALGSHGIGYEVAGTRGGVTIFVTATKQSVVTITPQPRRQMLHRVTVKVEKMQSRAVQRFSKQPNGEIKQETVVQTSPATTTLHERRADSVNISNGFFREVPNPTTPQPGEDPNQRFLKELKERAWVPVRHKVIYFATNRNIVNAGAPPGERFGTDVGGSVHYGSCQVTIPSEKVHKPGVLEQARWWGQDPEKYFSIEAQAELTENDFFQAAANALRDQTARQDVLLFVHGFNNTFEFAVMRAAQVVNDVQFPGFPVVFSFPSLGSLADYPSDEDHAARSVASLAAVLTRLVTERRTLSGPPAKIHIVAHSLGNRMLLSAMAALAPGLPAGEKAFGHVVLAAPDVDIPEFIQKTTALISASDDVTFYFCEKDVALLASRTIHHQERAGEALVTVSQLVNVDAANANTSLLGHDYYASSSRVLIDEDLLINQGIAAALRPTLQVRNGQNPAGAVFPFWIFPEL
jgi:esterase/lipase superfamily enzyme